MTSIYLNSSSNNYLPYPSDHHHDHNEDQISNHQFLSPNSQASSSSNSLTCHLFLNSNAHDQENGVFHRELKPPQHQQESDNFGSQAYDDHQIENDGQNSNNGGLKFSLWKNDINNMNDQNQVKWLSSKMRVMLKMKKSIPMEPKTFSTSTTREVKLEDHQDHKVAPSHMEETDNSSNSTSSNNNIPIRVCSDCNTTKTPLWRSGPRGPKSLCNACGIRQRKARRAAAAAAAAKNDNNVPFNQQIMAPLKVTKLIHKDQKKTNNGHGAKYKKRQYSKQIIASPSPSSSSPARKNCVEDFLASLSKNLAFHRVFPQDEKEAAILLMALSCGYVHE